MHQQTVQQPEVHIHQPGNPSAAQRQCSSSRAAHLAGSTPSPMRASRVSLSASNLPLAVGCTTSLKDSRKPLWTCRGGGRGDNTQLLHVWQHM
jgi:hypothetical protein